MDQEQFAEFERQHEIEMVKLDRSLERSRRRLRRWSWITCFMGALILGVEIAFLVTAIREGEMLGAVLNGAIIVLWSVFIYDAVQTLRYDD